MKDLKLNTVDGLTRLMDEMNNVLTKKIEEAKLNESVAKIGNISFLECQQLLENISDRLYDSKVGSKFLAKYIKAIKESKDLKRLYLCSDLLKNTNKCQSPELLVNETTNLMSGINGKNLNKELANVRSILKEAVVAIGVTAEDIISAINEEKELNTDINFILTEKKTPANIVDYTNAMKNVITHVSNNKDKNVNESIADVTIKDIEKLMSGDLELWENRAIEKLIISNLSDNDKKGIFEEYKKNCMSLIDGLLCDEDNQTVTKSQLNTMKEGLEKKDYNYETANDDILKLAQLENTLQG